MVKALERRGAIFVKSEEKDVQFMTLRVDGEIVRFEFTEVVEKKEAESWTWRWERWNCSVTGRLQFRIFATEPKGARRCWTDCTHYQLEEKVGEIVHWMFITAEATKKERLAREERWRQWEAEQKRKEEERRRQEEIRTAEECKLPIEGENRARLEENSLAWWDARRLRRFIRACESVLRKDARATPASGWRQAWLAWAREHADRLDPMTNGFLEREQQRLTHPKDDEKDPL